MDRELLSVPRPDHVENMTDYMQNHKPGDIFPYVSVYGKEEETKTSRLARLRSVRSAYGKVNKPELRINGIILDETEGTIQVQHLKEYVNSKEITRKQARENKKFKSVMEGSFSKPYLQISRIEGEYVPLMSSTSDYTQLCFVLEDGRLLEGQVSVQSESVPTNLNGVFELSCDYCISRRDLSQLSLKYFLARPIMKEGFQWGSVSLKIRYSEADTPYLAPKVEAMAIARAPYTALEERTSDPDHKDILFTAGQLAKLRNMYLEGDIADIDEPKKERAKKSSYSKSTLRGGVKGQEGPTHFEEQDGWEHLKGMRKPNLPIGEASESVPSEDEDDETEEDNKPKLSSKEQYEKHQEQLRLMFRKGSGPDSPSDKSTSPTESEQRTLTGSPQPKSAMKKRITFAEPQALQPPNTDEVFEFN
jgi:hypothetical protein